MLSEFKRNNELPGEYKPITHYFMNNRKSKQPLQRFPIKRTIAKQFLGGNFMIILKQPIEPCSRLCAQEHAKHEKNNK